MENNNSNDDLLLALRANEIKTRNRISLVCQACRKSKTKCDREKPRCSRCAKNNLRCIYNVAKKQVPHKLANKDATIAKLQNDVDYWKEKATNLADPNRSADPSDLKVNLYKDFSTMISSKVMKHDVKPLSENFIIVQDKFISTLISSIFVDRSNYANSMIPALTANVSISCAQPSVKTNALKLKEILIKQCKDESQVNRIDEFTDRILQNTNSSRNLKIGMIISLLYNTVGHEYLEDRCPREGEYSKLLNSLIDEFETLLPPFSVINYYKEHFFKALFPNFPFLEKALFEESLSNVLHEDPSDASKIKLELGFSHLRTKIENLNILLVILKLSFISLKYMTCSSNSASVEPATKKRKLSTSVETEASKENIIEKYPITNDFILLAQRCLASENWCACPNENIISCMLYIWTFFAFSPEESDFFLENPTDMIASLILMLSTSIGLHRDPSDFSQLKDEKISTKRLLNFRRLLWICVITVCSYESSLKGRHPLLSRDLSSLSLNVDDPEALRKYLERVKHDLVSDEDGRNHESDRYLLNIHEYTHKRVQLSLLLTDFDDLTLSSNKAFHLKYLELMREKIEVFVKSHFEIIDLKKLLLNSRRQKRALSDNVDTSEKAEEFPDINLVSFQNANAIQSRIMYKLVTLRSSHALLLYFENKLSEEPTSQNSESKSFYLGLYSKYLKRTCLDSLSIIELFNNFFSGKYSDYLLPASNYHIIKMLQISLPTTLFSLLGLIIRISSTNDILYTECQKFVNRSDKASKSILKDLNIKLEKNNMLQKELEASLEAIYAFASNHLRFQYFSVFKLFALFDVIIRRMRRGELWLGIFKLAYCDQTHSRISKTIRMTLGVQIDEREKLIERLKQKNHLRDIPVQDYINLHEKVHQKFEKIPKPKLLHVDNPIGNSTNNGSTHSAAMTDSDEVGEENRRMTPFASLTSDDSLQKLSSAALISQSLDMQTRLKSSSFPNNLNNDANIAASTYFAETPINLDIQNKFGSETVTANHDNVADVAGQYLQNSTDQNMPGFEFSGLFGGLDLFDYEFLFGNDFS
ncbi:hypothetical protein KAFR_0I00230 [Kazachstania africana CBS 2517]|uniref:Zn(2)-C6 fungal-type domain-containing protein n=1 Tax=Kazachstania africana (strain ATCC 22294 / BCRC 22015 / CBS 2517 / CECT 1963 / NBRC 1671 / NRRL Y-8276) TaxID=1071382 RepID=H2AZK4_KAZAF|nr:hypothetical protein KAFR_0I00230 [Kazachstania africana CBS 2517]CCF59804.1 hypothetical protein KAFR_0I00230 [Kazachstania africana CBS 2517]